MAISLRTSFGQELQCIYAKSTPDGLICRIHSFNGKAGAMSRSKQWEPIQYTSLKGWMFLNYTLLVLLISFVVSVGYLGLQICGVI